MNLICKLGSFSRALASAEAPVKWNRPSSPRSACFCRIAACSRWALAWFTRCTTSNSRARPGILYPLREGETARQMVFSVREVSATTRWVVSGSSPGPCTPPRHKSLLRSMAKTGALRFQGTGPPFCCVYIRQMRGKSEITTFYLIIQPAAGLCKEKAAFRKGGFEVPAEPLPQTAFHGILIETIKSAAELSLQGRLYMNALQLVAIEPVSLILCRAGTVPRTAGGAVCGHPPMMMRSCAALRCRCRLLSYLPYRP